MGSRTAGGVEELPYRPFVEARRLVDDDEDEAGHRPEGGAEGHGGDAADLHQGDDDPDEEDLGHETDSTILGGVVELAHHGAWDIALVVFVASVVIPISKFVVILYLVASIRTRTRLSVHARIHLYEVVEFIGRWSMIDVFVVAILSALVQLGFLASINPGTAAVFFALSVAFTMLSAQSLDPRLIWDSAEPEPPADD